MFPVQQQMQQTLVMIKPHIYNACLLEVAICALMDSIRARHCRVVGALMVNLTSDTMRLFYAEHEGKSFFEETVAAGSEGPSFVFVVEGVDAIARMRKELGPFDGSGVGTLRSKYIIAPPRNGFHASDSEESYRRERDLILKQVVSS